MKGFGKQVKGVFSSKWSGWIFLAAVLQTMFPFLIKSMVLFVTKESQGNLVLLAAELAALLVSGAVLCIPVKKNGGAGGSFWLKGYLPYAAAVCAGGVVFQFVGYATGLFYWILLPVAAILVAAAVVHMINRMVYLVEGQKGKENVGKYILACIVILLGQYLLPYLASGVFTRLLLQRMVWMISLLYFLLSAILLWAASGVTAGLAASGCVAVKDAAPAAQEPATDGNAAPAAEEPATGGNAAPTAQEPATDGNVAPAVEEPAAGGNAAPAAQATATDGNAAPAAEEPATGGNAAPAAKKKSMTGVIVSAAVIAVSMVCSIRITPSLVTRFQNSYASGIVQMRECAGNGDYVAASKIYKELYAELDAWEAALEQSNSTIESIYWEYPDNTTVAYLLAAGKSDSSYRLAALEKLYMTGKVDTNLWYTILAEYKNAESLTEEQKNRQREILSRLAAMRIYTGGYDSMEELRADGTKLTESIDELKNLLDNQEFIVLMGQMQIGDLTDQGGILVSMGFGDSLRRQIFYEAQDHPDSFTKQFLALYALVNSDGTVATEGAYFGGDQYVGVIDRFTELLDEKQEEFSGEALQTLQQLAIKAYMTYMATEKCADYCEKIMESNDDYSIRLNAMYCYLDSGRPEKCVALAKSLLAEKKDDVAGLYYLGAASVALKDTDTVIDCAENLAEQLKTTEYPDYIDSYLSQLISEITVYRSSTLAEYHLEGCYDDFTDSQLRRIEQNTFLNAYIQAYRAAIDPDGVNRYTEDTDAGLEYIDQMLAVRQDLGYAYYLKGAIYNGRWEDEKAAACFEEAVKYQQDDPMLWYALYDACDAIGEYEKAYYALSVCRQFMPWEDYYGGFDNGLPHIGVYRAGLIGDLEREHEELLNKIAGEVEQK